MRLWPCSSIVSSMELSSWMKLGLTPDYQYIPAEISINVSRGIDCGGADSGRVIRPTKQRLTELLRRNRAECLTGYFEQQFTPNSTRNPDFTNLVQLEINCVIQSGCI